MKKNAIKTILICIGVAIVSVFATLCVVLFPHKDKTPTAKEIFFNNLYSVVEVKSSTESVGESFGTAEFVLADGTLVTNAHVVTYTRLGIVQTFEKYEIRFATEDDYRAVALIKYDTNLDVAVLKLTDTNCVFKPVAIGVSATLNSGDKVYAIGNAVNYGLSMSEGIVGIPLIQIEYSNATREVIQCDLTIAEGNSGGALLNEKGQLIGITTFRTKDGVGNVVYGLAYCLPIDLVMEYVKR